MVADLVPAEHRGRAYGLYHTAVGSAAFPASLIAGALWQTFSPAPRSCSGLPSRGWPPFF